MKRRHLLLGATTAAIVLSAALTVGSDAFAAAGPGDIVIGAAVGLSGVENSFDVPSLSGFKVYLDEVNAKGGVNGRKLVLKVVDTTSTKPGGKAAAERLISDGAQIILTSANFDFGSPAGNVAQSKNILNFSLGAGSPLYGPVGIGPQAYSSAPSTYLEGHVMAQTLADLGKKKPFLLTDDTFDYGTQVGQGARERFDQLGIPVAGEATFKNNDSSIATQISKIESSGADSIVLSSYVPGAAAALRQIRSAGINLPVVSDLGMGGTDWTKAVPNLSDFYVTALASIYGDDPDPEAQSFVAAFKKSTGNDPATTQVIEGYNVAELIVAALEKTGGDTSGPKLSEALDGFTNYKMLGGAITYNDKQHIKQDGPLTVLKFQNGTPSFHTIIKDSGHTQLGQ
jgi:branched-chain amino acid transport system substrate-binding protein